MRLLLLASALLLSACGITGEYYNPDGRLDRPAAGGLPPESEARADSLLALPPDALTEADVQWLTLYNERAARANERAQVEEVRETRRSANAWIIASLVLGVAGSLATYFIIQDSLDY